MTVPATAANTAAPRTHHPARIIGCDVGKSAVVVFDSLTGRTTEHANDAEALAALAADLARDAPADCLPADWLVVCEATGGYESTLLAAVAAAGIPAHRADARKVKAFIRSLGRLAKTDIIDARALARYGQERHAELARWQPAPHVREDLRTLTRLRTQLVRQRVALTNSCRRRAAPSPSTACRRCAMPPPPTSPPSRPTCARSSRPIRTPPKRSR